MQTLSSERTQENSLWKEDCSLSPIQQILIKERLLNDVELRTIFRSLYKGSSKDICKIYGCNRGNFSAWLSGKRQKSPASTSAVRRFLLCPLNRDAIHLTKYVSEIEIERCILERVKELRTIVYLDGDNVGGNIDTLSVLLSEKQLEVLVICVQAKNMLNTVVSEIQQECEWLLVHQTLTCAKDATDQVLVYLSTIHHFLLRERLDIEFIFISRDQFLSEPKERLESRGRPCFTADGFKVTPAMAVLLSLGEKILDLLTLLSRTLLEPILEENPKDYRKYLRSIAVKYEEDQVQARVARKILGTARSPKERQAEKEKQEKVLNLFENVCSQKN